MTKQQWRVECAKYVERMLRYKQQRAAIVERERAEKERIEAVWAEYDATPEDQR